MTSKFISLELTSLTLNLQIFIHIFIWVSYRHHKFSVIKPNLGFLIHSPSSQSSTHNPLANPGVFTFNISRISPSLTTCAVNTVVYFVYLDCYKTILESFLLLQMLPTKELVTFLKYALYSCSAQCLHVSFGVNPKPFVSLYNPVPFSTFSDLKSDHSPCLFSCYNCTQISTHVPTTGTLSFLFPLSGTLFPVDSKHSLFIFVSSLTSHLTGEVLSNHLSKLKLSRHFISSYPDLFFFCLHSTHY